MDPREYNRRAWNAQVARGNRWTLPVTSAEVAAARAGEWKVVLTPTRAVPRDWFPPLPGLEILGLASAGGQQCPLFAAAGARVTVLDQSEAQLGQDRMVADRDRLELTTVRGDMADLSPFPDRSFDLIFHPCANGFVPDLRPVWREAFRVLRPGGRMLAGFVQPSLYIFDEEAEARGELVARHKRPYSDLTRLTREELDRRIARDEPVSFGHSLEDQIGGQLDAGFVLTGYYDDVWDEMPLSQFLPPFGATRAIKPATAG